MTAIAVVTTVGDKKEARRMAQALVEGGLAACAQIEKIDSVYAWKGKIEHGKEYRVLFKTVEARYDAVERAIRDAALLRAPRHPRRTVHAHLGTLRRMDRGERRVVFPA
jgi:periplasmic divalent cation tolerance protein